MVTSIFAHLGAVFQWVCIIFGSSFAFNEFHEFITSILQFSLESSVQISFHYFTLYLVPVKGGRHHLSIQSVNCISKLKN